MFLTIIFLIYTLHTSFLKNSWMIYFAPLSKVMNQVEFRVLNILFCDAHLINRSVPFDEYVAIVLERSIMSLIETRPVVIVFFFLVRRFLKLCAYMKVMYVLYVMFYYYL